MPLKLLIINFGLLSVLMCADFIYQFVNDECAMDNSVNWTDIEKCLDSGKGDELLVRNGKRTKDVNPKITFIPTIIFNNNYREALQKIALSNFLEIVEFLVEEIECERCRTRSGGTELYLTSFSVVLVFLPLIKIF